MSLEYFEKKNYRTNTKNKKEERILIKKNKICLEVFYLTKKRDGIKNKQFLMNKEIILRMKI